MNSNNAKRVVFVHPDLGIGGAERLVVDAAVALQQQGHQAEFYTSHCDRSHAFEEVQRGLLPVTVYGDWLPRSVFGRFHVVCAIVRMLWVSLWLLLMRERIDVIFWDQVSYCVPLLRFTGAKIIFYIHFPDKLLAAPGGALKRLYRRPLDHLEEVTTGMADVLVCNSQFTAGMVRKHFPSIRKEPAIVHPTTTMKQDLLVARRTEAVDDIVGKERRYFLSINRFEQKKNLELAIDAFALLEPEMAQDTHLVLAGGYDDRVEENARVFEALTWRIEERKLKGRVSLVRNVSQALKTQLLQNCVALIYTPRNEHFGIVPLEAMALGRPVIASDTGGPTETVAHEETGFLCEDTPEAFSRAMRALLGSDSRADVMGRAGMRRVHALFGPDAFAKKLASLI
jgi:alpha-1,3/alpha-1,6-mannosyltransferase